jgi:hypothetical protein
VLEDVCMLFVDKSSILLLKASECILKRVTTECTTCYNIKKLFFHKMYSVFYIIFKTNTIVSPNSIKQLPLFITSCVCGRN